MKRILHPIVLYNVPHSKWNHRISSDLCIYQIIKIGTFPPTIFLQRSALGAPFLLATRRKTPAGCGTRASPYGESQAPMVPQKEFQ